VIGRLAVSILLLSLPAAAETPAPADLVVVNGKVLTVDPGFRIAEAVAVRDGAFVLVGTSDEARRLVGKATRVIDARGGSVVPGLIDSHVHALDVAAGEMKGGFRELRAVDEIQQWIGQQAEQLSAGKWIWSPRVYPTRLH